MQLKQIITERLYKTWPSYDLIQEWEDEIVRTLNVELFFDTKYRHNRIMSHIPFWSKCLLPSSPAFMYNMSPNLKNDINNKRTIVPCIIDFYINEPSKLQQFYHRYDKHPVVLISSREVFNFLKNNQCPLNIDHLPLSISSKYLIHIERPFEKKYDLVMLGRQNPLLEDYVKKYAKEHSSFVYVYRIQKNGIFNYYTSKGELLGNINNREKYVSLMRQARVGLYSTPGIDGGEKRTNGFNQVTPRFLEFVACGCHIIARYPNNADTDYYELSKFSPSICNYEQFEQQLNTYLSKDVDVNFYSKYLEKHYTSQRCKDLQQILEQY